MYLMHHVLTRSALRSSTAAALHEPATTLWSQAQMDKADQDVVQPSLA